MKVQCTVAGRPWDVPAKEVPSPTGRVMALPDVGEADVAGILRATSDNPLAEVRTDDVIAFLHNVGKNWKSPEYARRRLYVRNLCTYLGYSARNAEHQADWIAMYLCSHFRMHSQLHAELGDRYALDRWVPNGEAEIRAFPRGRVAHVLAGNLPEVSLVSLLRGLLTRNVNLVKLPTGDPLTASALAASFADVDAEHPVSRAVSVLWWSNPQGVGASLVGSMDAVCAWGGAEAMDWVASAVTAETEVLWFGPRQSAALVDTSADPVLAAQRLAHDVGLHDQRGCFSSRRAFVVGDVHEFATLVARALAEFEGVLPLGAESLDEQAARSLALLEAGFAGDRVVTADPTCWAVVVGAPRAPASAHPGGRVVFLHPVADLREGIAALEPPVQTIAVHPYDLAARLRDDIARAGASRVVELGLSNLFRTGAAHDGVFPLARLVRFVSCELPASAHVSGITMTVDQTKFLAEHMLPELIP